MIPPDCLATPIPRLMRRLATDSAAQLAAGPTEGQHVGPIGQLATNCETSFSISQGRSKSAAGRVLTATFVKHVLPRWQPIINLLHSITAIRTTTCLFSLHKQQDKRAHSSATSFRGKIGAVITKHRRHQIEGGRSLDAVGPTRTEERNWRRNDTTQPTS